MGFLSGLSLRPSFTGDILRFPIVRVPSRLPFLGSFVVVAMGHFVSLVASCLFAGWIASVDLFLGRHRLGVLAVHILGTAFLSCVFGTLLVRGSILVVVWMRSNPLLPLLEWLSWAGMCRWDSLESRLFFVSELSFCVPVYVVPWLTLFLSQLPSWQELWHWCISRLRLPIRSAVLSSFLRVAIRPPLSRPVLFHWPLAGIRSSIRSLTSVLVSCFWA